MEEESRSDTTQLVERPAFLPSRRRDPEAGWHVLHTLSRQEKALAASLAGMGLTSYLPLRRHVTRRAGRRSEANLPLFPGYVFLWGSRDEAFLADRTKRVAQLIRVPDQDSLEWELSNLDRALAVEAPLDPFDSLRVGIRARIAAGPFEGIEGLVADRRCLDRLVLQVRMLGTAASLEVDAGLVETLDDTSF